MAKATFQCHECGDSVTVVGCNRAAADRLAKYRQESEALCHECWLKAREVQRAEESQKAAEDAVMSGLPVLQGTEKQIAWAETIRKINLKKLQKIEDFAKEGDGDAAGLAVLVAAFDAIHAQDAAYWWIETRDEYFWTNTRDFIIWLVGGPAYMKLSEPEIIARAAVHLGGLKKPEFIAPPEIIADAKAEAVVRPAEPKTETIAELLIVGSELHVTFPEKREDFRETAKKQLGMTWGDGYWKRTIGSMAGAIEDRLVEAGHRLLAAGFVVRIYDPDLRARAVSGEFEPEHTRWVTRRTQGAKAGWFCILWGRDEDYYAPARKLPRSQYDKPYVVVPPEQFDEVMDFAERYDFRLTQSGRELAEQARVNRDAALVAKVEPKAKAQGNRIEQVNKPQQMPVPDQTEVDDALRDE